MAIKVGDRVTFPFSKATTEIRWRKFSVGFEDKCIGRVVKIMRVNARVLSDGKVIWIVPIVNLVKT